MIQIDNVDILWQTKKTLQLNQSNYFHKLQTIDENLRGTLHVSEYFRIQPLKQHTQPHPARLKTRRKKSCFQKPCWFWSTQSLEHHGTKKVPWHRCHQKAKSYHDLTSRWILQRLHTTSLITLLNIMAFFAKHHALLRNSVHHVPVGHLCTSADHESSPRSTNGKTLIFGPGFVAQMHILPQCDAGIEVQAENQPRKIQVFQGHVFFPK